MAYGRAKGGWRRGTQGLRKAGASAFEWRIIGDTGAAVAIPGSIQSPDWHACLEFADANRRAFAAATTFRVVGGSPTRVAFEFTTENVDRWAAFRAGQPFEAAGAADRPHDAGTAPVVGEVAGTLAGQAPWEG